MSTQNLSAVKAFQATGVAINEFVRVKVDSNGLISAAAATDYWIGITQEKVAASGYGSVRLRNSPGTYLVTASAAITKGNPLYPTASGKVADAAGTGVFTGLIALQEATADGDIIEAAPVDVVAFTASADQAACPAGGTGAAAGGWDTSGHRDAAILLINAMRTALINAGIMKGSA